MALSWKPRLYGPMNETYCSPACGGGCTRESYEKAHELSKKLASRLGKGWTTRVWENLGWHYCVISPCERIKVHYNGGSSYTAFLGEPKCSGGRWAEHGKTPEAVIKRVIASAKTELKKIGACIAGL
jgi:hypothetical protein